MLITPEAAELFDAPVVLPSDRARVGPFTAIATPGHSADSVCLVFGRACFTGDTVLGQGSVFIAPGEGSLSAYLDSLRRLRELDLDVICPGHGPYVRDPGEARRVHSPRLDRERRLGGRTRRPACAPATSSSTPRGRTPRRRAGRPRR